MTQTQSQLNLAEAITKLSPAQRDIFIEKLPPAAAERVKELLTEFSTAQAQAGAIVELLPHQRIPPPNEIDRGHVFAGGRGAGKTLATSAYVSRIAESTPNIRMRVIAPTLSDAVNSSALDPMSGILAHSPSATFKPSGLEGARITWPNGAICFLVGTPTLKDVDRLRALTNIDLDVFEEAAANPRLKEAKQQADLSRRGSRLHHPIWIAATTPRPVPTYKEWLEDPRVSVTRAGTADNPHTPDTYREYAESLKGTHLYRQEILGEVVDDVRGALWTQVNIDRSMVSAEDQPAVMAAITRVVVGVDPPSGHGTAGIVVVGATDPALDPAGQSRIVVLDDFSISEASPMQWGRRVVEAASKYGAHIVAERNQGGLMVESTIQQAVDPGSSEMHTVTLAHAAISKERRASPVALLWEVTPQRAVIVPPDGSLARLAPLVEQLTSWVPGTFSPDRLDAMVWAATYLFTGAGAARAVLQAPTPRKTTSPGTSFRNALMGRR